MGQNSIIRVCERYSEKWMLNRLFSVAQGKATRRSTIYMFILVLETLFVQVRCNADILTFTVESISKNFLPYADDAYYFLKDTAS